jgi:hypothetical protein
LFIENLVLFVVGSGGALLQQVSRAERAIGHKMYPQDHALHVPAEGQICCTKLGAGLLFAQRTSRSD